MKKASPLILLLSLMVFASCSSKITKTHESEELASEAIEAEFGSAFPKDTEERIIFLKSKIAEKEELMKKNEESGDDLTAELLENEILLLEAEQFSLEGKNVEE